MDGCCVCGVKLFEGTDALYRVNEKGVPGVWACDQHIKHFPLKQPDDEVRAIVEAVKGAGR